MSGIVDTLKMYLNRLKKPATIAEALRQVISPELVDELVRDIDPAFLVEEAAEEVGISASELLRQVAYRLNLRPALRLELPKAQLLEKVGHETKFLQAIYALPYAIPSSRVGYGISVTELSNIDVEAFKRQGIEVTLALGSKIEKLWKRFEWETPSAREQVSVPQMFAVVKQLAEDAFQCGTSEVFIGHPQPDCYEFLAADKKYTGKLHPLIYKMMLNEFKDVHRITREVTESETLRSISVSLTRSFERPVVCLTWETKAGAQRIKIVEALDTPSKLTTSASKDKPEEKSVTDSQITRPVSLRKAKTGEEQQSAEKIVEIEEPAERIVLLVDDDERFLLILSRIMESKGWTVETEKNGKAALESLRKNSFKPALAISYVHMPEMDGGSFLKAIRNEAFTMPVLMLTSDDDRLLEAELALLGADAFVRKQEDPRILLAWCNNLVARSAGDVSQPEQTKKAVGAS